jgi:hypothetical protein
MGLGIKTLAKYNFVKQRVVQHQVSDAARGASEAQFDRGACLVFPKI